MAIETPESSQTLLSTVKSSEWMLRLQLTLLSLVRPWAEECVAVLERLMRVNAWIKPGANSRSC